jgi:hypothetical protein
VSKNNKKTKRGIFTYFDNEVRSITKTFNKFNVKTAFRTKNTIDKLLKPTEQMNKYENKEIYKLKCLTCQGLYIGQTGRNFKASYKEHIRDIRYNKPKKVMYNIFSTPATNTGTLKTKWMW